LENSSTWASTHAHTVRYDTRCYFNVRSKADISQLNLPHGTARNRGLVCLSVCALITTVSVANAAELIQMPLNAISRLILHVGVVSNCPNSRS